MKSFTDLIRDKKVKISEGLYQAPELPKKKTITEEPQAVVAEPNHAAKHHSDIAQFHKEAHEFFKQAGHLDRAAHELSEHYRHSEIAEFLGSKR